jgi:alpha-aminoadipate/glutamate carrier protein LysW
LVYCPECDTNLDLEEDEMDEGDVVSCPECGTEYEIITISPIELKPVEDEAYEEEEEEEAEDGDFS